MLHRKCEKARVIPRLVNYPRWPTASSTGWSTTPIGSRCGGIRCVTIRGGLTHSVFVIAGDLKGIHIKTVAKGELRNIPRPEAIQDSRPGWDIQAWSRYRFLGNAFVLTSPRASEPFQKGAEPLLNCTMTVFEVLA